MAWRAVSLGKFEIYFKGSITIGGAGCGAGSGADPQQLVIAAKAARAVPRRASFMVVFVFVIELE